MINWFKEDFLIVSSEFSRPHQVLVDKFIKEFYIEALKGSGKKIHKCSVEFPIDKNEDTAKELMNLGELKVIDHASDSGKYTGATLCFNDGILQFTDSDFGDDYVSLMTTNLRTLEKFKSIVSKVTKKSHGSVDIIISDSDGPSFQSLDKVHCPLEARNYRTDTIDDYSYIVDQLKHISPKGRLAVIDGPPGTGKTYLMKSLIGDLSDFQVVIIPARFVGELDSPGLIPLLMRKSRLNKGKPIILIVEDADKILVPRSAGNMSGISSLLNYTDGIFGSAFNLRIVATTNAHKYEMDEALLRPGRLIKRMTVDKLRVDKANEIYSRLTGEAKSKFKSEVSLAEVYAEAHGVSVETVDNGKKNEKKIMGFGK